MSVVEIQVIALTAGSTGNLGAGERLTLRAPIAGVESGAIVSVDGIAGGQDRETDDSLRERILSVIQNPPQGGSIEDYVQLASSIPGVGRVFVTPGIQGVGTVGVSFLTSDSNHLIPAPQLVQQVQEYLDIKKPVTAIVLVFAPTPVPLNVTVSNLSPDTPEIRQAVAEEIADLILREATPGGSILLSHIREAVSVATGENDHVLISPTGNVGSSLTEILVPGVLSFV